MGRSNAAPTLRTSAGARLTVTRALGNGNPELRIAVRTRSRLSRTVASGSPTIVMPGRPFEHVDFDRHRNRVDADDGGGLQAREHGV